VINAQYWPFQTALAGNQPNFDILSHDSPLIELEPTEYAKKIAMHAKQARHVAKVENGDSTFEPIRIARGPRD